MKWAIGITVCLFLFAMFVVTIACFNKCTRIFYRSEAAIVTARPKVAINKKRYIVTPIDKRILLRTGDYTVEQSWEQITVRFFNREYFEKFKDSLLCRYPLLANWKDPRRKPEGQVTNASGQQVRLALARDTRAIFVTDVGASSWVMSDFQTICKNIHVTGIITEQSCPTPPRPLSPRQPTIGERFFDGGDYKVKVSQSEIEIKFVSEELFESFKRVLFARYPALPWNKFLQRDCARIQLESGKMVTIHMWEGVRSVWLSGDGKRDWYSKEFYEIHADAAVGKIPPGELTVKRLETGGFEVEFPSSDYLIKVRELIDVQYATTNKWRDVNCLLEVTLFVPLSALVSVSSDGTGSGSKSIQTGASGGGSGPSRVRMMMRSRTARCPIVVQLGSANVGDRKLWVVNGSGNGSGSGSGGTSDPTNIVGRWIDCELRPMYETARNALANGAHHVAVAGGPSTS